MSHPHSHRVTTAVPFLGGLSASRLPSRHSILHTTVILVSLLYSFIMSLTQFTKLWSILFTSSSKLLTRPSPYLHYSLPGVPISASLVFLPLWASTWPPTPVHSLGSTASLMLSLSCPTFLTPSTYLTNYYHQGLVQDLWLSTPAI